MQAGGDNRSTTSSSTSMCDETQIITWTFKLLTLQERFGSSFEDLFVWTKSGNSKID